MLTLDLPVEPYWLALPRGVRVEIRPVTTAVMAAAQAASARRLSALRAAEPELDPDMARGLAFAYLVKALARHAVLAWEGIGDTAGKPLPLSPDAVERLHRPRRHRGRRGKRLRARAAWHFGSGPEYCRGCVAIARDCGDSCPYSQHAPLSIEAHACWAAGTACAEASMAGITLNIANALAAARDLGAQGWAASEMLMALRIGMAEGIAIRGREETPHG
jgi:hypothetical protein